MITMEHTTSATVTSTDRTVIAYERTGHGPALILIDAAGHYREFTSFADLIGLLAQRFTLYHYDRRGRGRSTDTQPYAVAREVEDLAALIDRGRRLGLPVCVLLRWTARPARRSSRLADRTDGTAGTADRAGRGPLGAAPLHHGAQQPPCCGTARARDGVLPDRHRCSRGNRCEHARIGLLVGDGVGRAHSCLRQSDQRGDLIRSTGFGDSADPCARQRGKQRRPHRHGRHGGRRAAQGLACINKGRSGEVLDRLGECLGGHFDVSHCTFQLEPVGHQEHEAAHHA